jgi:23S rRNA-/tRNA-specific pseudouridylate synthase
MSQDPPHTPLPVIAAGDGWLVVDKPAGISVHNDPGRDLCAHVKGLLVADRRLADKTGFADDGAIRAPHRLDRDTSGLVLLCCKASTLAFYGAAFQARRIGKCYLAILHGRLDGPAGAGVWAFALARSGAGRRHPAGRGKRVACRTAFQVLFHSDRYTLAAITPMTGRPHQIRRHAKLSGHPVVGDRRYGSTRSLRYLKEKAGFARLGLHAYGLDLPMPGREHRQVVLAGSLPPAFHQLLAADGGSPGAAVEKALRDLADPRRWPGYSAHP